jgi:WD40 repeat protein
MAPPTPCPKCGKSAETRYRPSRNDWICDTCDHRWQAPAPDAGGIVPLKIFLSYGHDEHLATALRIKADLEARGHQVWFDAERLREGRDWERYIEEGLGHCDKVVLLMTPHSVRRRNPRDPESRDGYCLNEIAKAIEKNKLIVPVMLVTLDDGPPTSICRIQYLDLRDTVPVDEHEEQYKVRLERLAKAIEKDDLDFEGGQARLARLLRPLSFDAEMSRHIASFTGRLWLLRELDEWLDGKPGSRVFWLMGGPGIGKTAVATYLVHRRPEVIGYHFCTHGHADKSDPATAVLSLAYQMAQHLPEYGKRLANKELEREVGKNAGTLFDNLIVEPLGKDFPAPDGPRLVLIDAIDEASRDGKNAIAELIRDHWAQTPPWLRLVITSRPEVEVVTTLGHLDPYTLDAQRAENLDDLERFLSQQLAARGIATSETLLRTILDKSEGIFLYVRVLLDEIDSGRLTLDCPDELPVGLFGHYQRFFSRQLPDVDRYQGELRPLLEVVCAGREPVPLAVIARAVGASGHDVRQRFARLGSLLNVRPGIEAEDDTVAPFHKSVRDWLTAIDARTRLTVAGPYAIDGARGEQCLADAVAKELKSDVRQSSAYALRHGPAHLVAAGRATEAAEVMTEFGYHHERLRTQGVAEVGRVAHDFFALTQKTLSVDIPARAEIWKRFFDGIAHFLRRPDVRPELQLLQRACGHADESPVARSAEKWLARYCCEHVRFRRLDRPKTVRTSACLRVFEGHSGAIHAIQVHPDGRRFVSASHDNCLKVWDIETGDCLQALTGHTDPVWAIALHADGRRAISASGDKTLKVWDLDTGQCLQTLAGHTQYVYLVALFGDGRRAISADGNHTLKVWDLDTSQCLETLACDPIRCVLALDPDGRRAFLASAGYEPVLALWDLEAGKCVRTFAGHSGSVWAATFHKDGRRVVSGNNDATLRVWDLNTAQCLCTLRGHLKPVHAVALHEDGRRAVSGDGYCSPGEIKVWDINTGECLRTFLGHTGDVCAVALHPDGRRAVSGDGKGAIRLWDIEADDSPRTCEKPVILCALKLHADGRRAVSSLHDGTIRIWDTGTGRSLHTLQGHTEGVYDVMWLMDGRQLLSRDTDGTIKIWDSEVGQCMRTPEERHARVVPHPDGRRVVSASSDGTIRIWDVETGFCLRTFDKAAPGYIRGVVFYDKVRRALSQHVRDRHGHGDGLAVWDLEHGKLLQWIEGEANAAAVHLDNRRAVSGDGGCDHTKGLCHPGRLRLWDLETGKCLRLYEGHAHAIRAVVLHPDGRRIISGGGDWGKPGEVKIWDMETGECLRSLGTRKGYVGTLILHPDNRTLLALSTDNRREHEVNAWDMDSGEMLDTWICEGDCYHLDMAYLSPGHLRLAAGCQDGSVHLFDVVSPAAPARTICSTWSLAHGSLASAFDSGTIALYAWHPASGHLEELVRSSPISGAISSLRFSLDGTRLQVLTADNTEHIFDATTLQPAAAPTCAWASASDTSPDGAWRAVIRDGRLAVEAAKP